MSRADLLADPDLHRRAIKARIISCRLLLCRRRASLWLLRATVPLLVLSHTGFPGMPDRTPRGDRMLLALAVALAVWVALCFAFGLSP